MSEQTWARWAEHESALIRSARIWGQLSDERRCEALEDGGVRCTRDRHPEEPDAHRIDAKDLPS